LGGRHGRLSVSESKKIKILKDVIGSYYRVKDEYLFFCPKCNHHKRKLSVNLNKDAFKCWVCDFSGKSIQRLIRKYGHYKQRIEWKELTNSVDVLSFTEQLFLEKEKEEEQIVILPEEFVSLANEDLPYNSLYPRNYLKSRGITKQDILKWKIGYCSAGKYGGRIIIPSFGVSGRCNYFTARTYQKDWKKYYNPPASRDIVFNHLYLDFDYDVTIVEGSFDAIVAGTNSVPLLGSTLRTDSKLFQEIVRNDSAVYIALDADAERKAKRLINNLLEYGIETHKIDIEPYSDVGEMTKEEFQKRKAEAEIMNSDNYLLTEILKI
tara:strand:+ start:24854 stop:25819 length:966 start_codon:yes stop_codon:yes gene_type:complete